MTAHRQALERTGPALHGWLIVDKAAGPGSTDIVSAAKRALRDGGYAKVKVGHGGTLDPLASGVLPIALGEATKLAGRMLDSDKAYEFTIAFGAETDTLDLEGKIIRETPLPTRDRVWAALKAFTGEISQIPPAYSALKVDGKRAYDLARAGEEVALTPRQIVVRDLYSTDRLGGSDRPMNETIETAELRAFVSKGTYIRSLARDIANHANSAGHVSHLRRIKCGPFNAVRAIKLDKLAELAKARSLEQALLPLAAGLDDIPALSVTPDQAGALRQGRQAIGTLAPPGLYLATERSVPVALVESDGAGLKVVRGFNL